MREPAGDTDLEKFTGVLEWIPDAAVVVDADGTIAFANRNAETLLAYPRSRLVGMTVEALLPERQQAAHVDHRRRYAATPVIRPMTTEVDLVARRKDGTEIPVDISLGPVYLNDRLLVIATIRRRGRTAEARAPLQTGDKISIGDDGPGARAGTILELVEGSGRAGYRVRWHDGRESIYYPAGGDTIRRLGET